MIFISLNICGYSSELSQTNWQLESLDYLGLGNAHLLSHEPILALENYQKASAIIDRSDNFSCVISFLICFGEAISYDMLGFHEHSKQSIGSLLLTINEYEAKDIRGEDYQCIAQPSDELEGSIELLHVMASMAPSEDVREFLFSFVEAMAEEVLPPFKIPNQSAAKNASWEFDYGDEVQWQKCKSFWKRMKHFFKEAAEALKYIAAGYKSIKDMKDTHKNWNNN